MALFPPGTNHWLYTKLLLACGSMRAAQWPLRVARAIKWRTKTVHRRQAEQWFAGLAAAARASRKTGVLTEATPAELTRGYFAARSLSGIAPGLCAQGSDRFVDSLAVVKNFDSLRATVDEGRGLVIASTHMGAMGVASARLVRQGVPVVILRDEQFRALEGTPHGRQFFLGARPIFLDAQDPSSVNTALLACARALRRGEVISYTVDAGHGGRYREGTVLGRRVEVRTALIELAARCGSPVISAFSYARGNRVHVDLSDAAVLKDAADVQEWTATFCTMWERHYLEHPTSVTWSQADVALASNTELS